MVLGTHVVYCVADPDFGKKIFYAPKMGEKMGQKLSFLNSLENVAIDFFPKFGE